MGAARAVFLATLLLGAGAHAASVDPTLSHYVPSPVELPRSAPYLSSEGEVRVVGYNDMRDMLEPIAALFTASHPQIRFKLDLPGTRFAPDALAKGQSAFAPMGAEFTPPQLAGYRALQPNDPLAIRVAHASLDSKALSGPLAVFVNAGNPIASLTLEQVARAFSGKARTWGELGLEGEWAKRPLKIHGLAKGTALSYAFAASAMGEREIDAATTGWPQSADVVREVARDPAAIGFGGAVRPAQGARAVAIVARAGEAPVALTEENIVAERYPLDRFLLVYVARPITPIAREFLRLMLSREGQELVAAAPQRYLPLSASQAAAELAKLDEANDWSIAGRPLPQRESTQPELDPRLAPYRPCAIEGTLAGSAPPILPQLVARWIESFRVLEPRVRVEVPPPYREPQAKGSPRLRMFIDGKIDFAFLGYDPLAIPVAGGSYRHFGFVDSVAVVVNRDNPIAGLTLAQLDAIFSKSRLRGFQDPAATWGDLGVAAWADKPIRVVGSGAWAGEESARATFIRERVMDDGARRGRWRDADPADQGDAIVPDAVAADRFAIGFTAMGHLLPGIRAIPVAPRAGEPYVEPSYENVSSAQYPLSRVWHLVVARKPGQSLAAPLAAFAGFLLSREGQQEVLAQGVFLPLRAEQAAAAAKLLGPAAPCSEPSR